MSFCPIVAKLVSSGYFKCFFIFKICWTVASFVSKDVPIVIDGLLSRVFSLLIGCYKPIRATNWGVLLLVTLGYMKKKTKNLNALPPRASTIIRRWVLSRPMYRQTRYIFRDGNWNLVCESYCLPVDCIVSSFVSKDVPIVQYLYKKKTKNLNVLPPCASTIIRRWVLSRPMYRQTRYIFRDGNWNLVCESYCLPVDCIVSSFVSKDVPIVIDGLFGRVTGSLAGLYRGRSSWCCRRELFCWRVSCIQART